MNRLSVVLDPAKTQGTIRHILGINNSPRISSVATMERDLKLFRKLNPARVRHHDCTAENGGYSLVDVSRIFPLFHADENDPRNYVFGPTDLYFKQIVKCGTPIELKFGEQIEHAEEQFRVLPPSDPQKWVRICLHIFRHYTEGWANGMHLKIEYVSLWEEPDNPHLFPGPLELYFELYKEFSIAMRAAFPSVKLCGFNGSGPWGDCRPWEFGEPFVRYCRDNDLPLDAFSFTSYGREPGHFAECAVTAKEMLKRYGYDKTEVFVVEWHMWPKCWMQYYDGEMDGAGNAAFTVCAMIRMLDCGAVDMAYFYAWAVGRVFSLVTNGPIRTYYALCRYSEMAGLQRIGIDADLPEDVNMLAGTAENGTVKLLISGFCAPRAVYELKVPGYTHCIIQRITDGNEDWETGTELEYDTGKQSFLLDAETGGSAVFALTFTK